MQQLQFEESWHKALCAQDRQNIERIFRETKHLNNSSVLCSPIREAINHKEALLVSVLVHNFTDHPLTFHNRSLLYSVQGDVIAEKAFTLPTFVIASQVSMPWTFIFPKDSYIIGTSFKNGRLEIL
ncbi:SLAP domain-containing protein [Metabacillus fastidiosus]|uniref:SLAP domain-containing protein n=1 Tax=Metabacillus fastidiosus TaxID=1458 RepID=UPI002DBAE57D|nr:SLAP domain-containing protein [Metabacillus fastidiosus]MEC2078223.1 SLAP domain-containing protein [Metabacillus fastidiosus]